MNIMEFSSFWFLVDFSSYENVTDVVTVSRQFRLVVKGVSMTAVLSNCQCVTAAPILFCRIRESLCQFVSLSVVSFLHNFTFH